MMTHPVHPAFNLVTKVRRNMLDILCKLLLDWEWQHTVVDAINPSLTSHDFDTLIHRALEQGVRGLVACQRRVLG